MRTFQIDFSTPSRPQLLVNGEVVHTMTTYNWCKVTPKAVLTNHSLPSTYCGEGLKTKAKAFHKKHGVTAKLCAKIINAAVYRATIGAVGEHKRLCFKGKTGLLPDRILSVCQHLEELDRAVADNNKNITPLIARFGMTPAELRKTLGKGLWKKLCAQSMTRNLHIANTLRSVEDIPILLEIPSTILRSHSSIKFKIVEDYIRRKTGWPIRKIVKPTPEVTRLIHMYLDTASMAEQTDQPFSNDWSLNRLEQEHARLIRVLRDQQALLKSKRNEKLNGTLREGKTVEWEAFGVNAKFLTTFQAVVAEGDAMRHCVAAYASDCMHGSYAVVHISGDGVESTLGIDITKVEGGLRYIPHQHYAQGNETVTSSGHLKMAEYVIKYLNEEVS